MADSRLPLPVPAPVITLPSYLPTLHASILTLGYVGSFYLSPTIRKLPKDDPRVMKSRLKVASGFTFLGWLSTATLLWKGMPRETHPTIKVPQMLLALGLPLPRSVPTFLTSSWIPLQPSLWSSLKAHWIPAVTVPLSLTALLFAGPLYVEWLDDCLPLPRWLCRRKKQKGGDSKTTPPTPTPMQKIKTWLKQWWNLFGLRNFIIGPLTEEIIWRSCILSVHRYSAPSPSSSSSWLIFGTPLWFGVAHLHHAWETYRTRRASNPNANANALTVALLQSSFQFAYTTVFGWYANWLFLRTGSIISPLLSHVFCNVMGFPNPFHAVKYFPDKKNGEWWTAATGIIDSHLAHSPLCIFFLFFSAIHAAHLAGIAGFAMAFNTFTQPGLFGGSVFMQ